MLGLQRTVGDWPELNANSLPERERRAANFIQGSLHGLSSYADDFGAAVRLFDESFNAYAVASVTDTTNDGLARMHIAARDGAVTIFNFAKTAETIQGKALTDCPTLSQHVDHKLLRAARKLLLQSFPDFIEIRHSVGHAAELRNEENHEVEALVGAVFPTLQNTPLGNIRTKITARNSLQGRTFTNTFDGRLCVYEVSAETHTKLNQTKEGIYAAFAHYPAGYRP